MKRFATFLVIFFLTSTIACQRSKTQSSFGGIPDDDYTGTGKTNTVQTSKLPAKQPNSLQASVPASVPTCFTLANQSLAVYNKCYATVADADQASDQCVHSLGQLANSLCTGLQTRINTAKSSCGGLFTQYRSLLPSACVTAINAVM